MYQTYYVFRPPHVLYINQSEIQATAFLIIVPSGEYQINGLNCDGGWGGSQNAPCLFDPVGGDWRMECDIRIVQRRRYQT